MAENTDQAAAGKKRKPLLLIVGAVLVLALGGGGAVLLLGGKGAKGAKGAKGGKAHAAAKKKPPQLGEVVPIDATTLNLADGHYLKVGVALQLSKAGSAEEIGKDLAPAQDATIDLLGSYTTAQLTAHGGKQRAKALLGRKVAELYEGKVLYVYFTDFVIQ
jgi:flagellar protein FliL